MSLEKIIKDKINQNSSAISFAEFMNLALYQQKYGYYRSGRQKFGAKGDFITAPELSPLFGKCLAKQIIEMQNKDDDILEFGAGSGILAVHILEYLALYDKLPNKYYILELSSELQKRQQEIIKDNLGDIYNRCVWLAKLPDNFNGVVIANEVLDAMPIRRFEYADYAWQEQYIDVCNNKLVGSLQVASDKRNQQLNSYFDKPPIKGYQTELSDVIKPWLGALYDSLNQAKVLLIDYGYSAKEYYHPQRISGTLRSYYQHKATDNPLIHLGEQDITASVNFSQVALDAKKLGFEILGFSTQGHFLMNLGLTDLLAQSKDIDKITLNQQAKQLIHPNMMGETFKVIALQKNGNNTPIKQTPLQGFCFGDLSHHL